MFKILIKSKLNDKEKKGILKLKDQFWSFGLKEQKKWFENNIKKKDIHIFFQKKNNIIAYNCLRIKKINKFSFFLLDTIIIDKKFKKSGYGGCLLDINKSISISKRKPIFLKTNQQTKSFYEEFAFKLIMKNSNFLYFTFNKNEKKNNFYKYLRKKYGV